MKRTNKDRPNGKKLSAFDSGSKVEFEARVRLLDKPQTDRLAVSASDLKDGNVFVMVAKKLVPKN